MDYTLQVGVQFELSKPKKTRPFYISNYPVLCFGEIGSGMTDISSSIAIQHLIKKEGVIYLDFGANVSSVSRIAAYAQLHDRLDDLFVINLWDLAYSDSIDVINPFIHDLVVMQKMFGEFGVVLSEVFALLYEQGRHIEPHELVMFSQVSYLTDLIKKEPGRTPKIQEYVSNKLEQHDKNLAKVEEIQNILCKCPHIFKACRSVDLDVVFEEQKLLIITMPDLERSNYEIKKLADILLFQVFKAAEIHCNANQNIFTVEHQSLDKDFPIECNSRCYNFQRSINLDDPQSVRLINNAKTLFIMSHVDNGMGILNQWVTHNPSHNYLPRAQLEEYLGEGRAYCFTASDITDSFFSKLTNHLFGNKKRGLMVNFNYIPYPESVEKINIPTHKCNNKKPLQKKDDEKKVYENKIWQQYVANDAKDVRSNSNSTSADLSKESYEKKKKELDENIARAGDEKANSANKPVEESKTLTAYKDAGLLKTTVHYNVHGARDQKEFLSKEKAIFERRQNELEAASKNQNLSPKKCERAGLIKDAEYHSYQSEQYSRVIEYEKTTAGFSGKERQPNDYDEQLNYHKNQANEAAQKLHSFDKEHRLVNEKCQPVADTAEFKRGRSVDPQEQQQALNYLKNLDISNQRDLSQTKEKEQAAESGPAQKLPPPVSEYGPRGY